jgi:hypothetical protein
MNLIEQLPTPPGQRPLDYRAAIGLAAENARIHVMKKLRVAAAHRDMLQHAATSGSIRAMKLVCKWYPAERFRPENAILAAAVAGHILNLIQVSNLG